MADTKISADPAATALASTDIVPVVQGGANKKATVAQLATATGRAASYLGQVARGYVPRGVFAGPAFKSANRTMQIRAMDTMAVVQMLWSNWYLGSNGVETSPGGSCVLKASIQYPIAANPDTGPWQQLKWGGASSVTMADGGDSGLCDALTLTTAIPVGADFLLRTHEEAASACLFTYNGSISSTLLTPGDLSVTANGTTDKTSGGAMSTSSYFFPYYPTLVVGQTRTVSIAIPGDSRVSGFSDTVDATLTVGNLQRSLANVAHINLASFGETLANFVGSGGAKRRALLQYFSHVATNYGVNDVSANTAEATLLANIASAAGTMRAALTGGTGGKVLWATYEPETNSTDGYVTLANQTKKVTTAQETVRVNVNNALRGRQIANVDACIDIAAIVESGLNSGFWTVLAQGGTAVAIVADGVHENYLGTKMIENARPIDPLMLAR